MGPLDLLRHPIILLSIAFHDFIHWYFMEKPSKIVKAYLEYFRTFNDIFSFLFLLRTLISPWRQIKDDAERKGFNIGLWAQGVTLNCTSRVIGFVFRITALSMGLLCQILLLIGFLLFFLVWMTFPVLFFFGVSFVISTVTFNA